MWLPNEWWIDLKKSGSAWTFTAGVSDLVKIESTAKFRWLYWLNEKQAIPRRCNERSNREMFSL